MNEWPILELIVCHNDPAESHVEALQNAFNALISETWVPEPPQFIDDTDHESVTRPGDVPIRTVGVLVPLLAPESEGEKLSLAEDQRQLQQAERFLNAMSDFSTRTGALLRVHYNEEEIGEIAGRDISRGVIDGLLVPWRKAVGVS